MNTNHPITGATAAILLCAALAAAAGSAQAQVNRCVDAEGRVTLTDEPCPGNSRAVNDDVSDNGAAGLVVTTGAQSAHLTDDVAAATQSASISTGLTRSRWADLPRPLVRNAAGTDVVTLQTARTTMLMRDDMRRQSRTVATR